MDFSSLFPSTDNLFKFLFLGGLIMVFTAMIYPLQKKQEREIEVVNHNQQVELINREISELRKGVALLSRQTKVALDACINLDKQKIRTKNGSSNRKISNQIAQIQKNINESAEIIRKKNVEITTKVIVVKYNGSKIRLLQKYVSIYDSYSRWLLCVGIPLSTIGLIFWTISTIKTERLKTKELNKP